VSEKKSWGDTMLGWFVERDGEKTAPPPRDPEAPEEPAVAEPEPTPAVTLEGELPVAAAPGAPFDFAAVYRAAGIAPEAQDRVEKAATLLGTLPADASKEVKRQIVEASLKAFGYPVEQIIEAGAAEIRALHVFIEFSERNNQQAVAETNQRIETLTREIEEARQVIEQKVSAQQQLAATCNAQKLRVQDVLEFFGQEAVARVVGPPPSKQDG